MSLESLRFLSFLCYRRFVTVDDFVGPGFLYEGRGILFCWKCLVGLCLKLMDGVEPDEWCFL